MIKRQISDKLLELSRQYPVVSVMGPRQSGKTTLVKAMFPDHYYVSMEDLDRRAQALADPRHFLMTVASRYAGMIIDEIQEAPELLSYMQGVVDANREPGRFILTGSQNFLIHQKISQTLAGRIALLTLFPLSVDELKQANRLPATLEEILVQGCYPGLYNPMTTINFDEWFIFYIATYVERDVRLIINIENLTLFQNFLKLCAGRVGQVVNYTTLASDCGISPNTAKAWLSLLEASYIIRQVQPYYKNFSKRVIKSPKLYFYDTGLLCALLEIKDPKNLDSHYMRGLIFESFIISECLKYRHNRGLLPNLYFWRDVRGHEIDCIIERGQDLLPIEIKSGKTINSSFFDGLIKWYEISEQKTDGYVIYGGTENQDWPHAQVIGWDKIKTIIDAWSGY